MDGREDGEELEGVEGREVIIRNTMSQKDLPSIKGK